MKRLIVAAILFVVVIATYLTSLFYITDSCDKAKSMVENSISVYTKNQTAKKEARNLENYWNILKYEIIKLEKDNIQNIHDVSEGLENRFIECCKDKKVLNEVLLDVKSKRYTYTRLKRIVLRLVLDINKSVIEKIYE